MEFRQVHGLVFAMSPEWYGFVLPVTTRNRKTDVKRPARTGGAAPGEPCMDGALALTLAGALAINIALLAHYLGQ
ncbi:MAG TPA: hypothetical protein VMJ73_03820 [Rhizomicrobium sp.]|nr:hypothetical protein [Rhizomicrobium sp.]